MGLSGMDYYPTGLNTIEIVEHASKKLHDEIRVDSSYDLLFRLAYWANESLVNNDLKITVVDDGKDWIRFRLNRDGDGSDFEIKDYDNYGDHRMFSFRWLDSDNLPRIMNTLPSNLISVLGCQ